MRRAVLGALLEADARSVARDPLLGWILLMPLGVACLLRTLVPRVSAAAAAGGIDPTPYYPLVMGGYVMAAPGIVGLVVGFLILDERDARTLSALRVTPLPMARYLAYRIALPLLVGTAATVAGYPLVGINSLPVVPLVSISLVAGLSAPLIALLLSTVASNKVAGFAVVKTLNAVNLLPIAAFFVPVPIQLVAGVLPTYWPMRALWSAAAGEAYTPYLVGGAATGIGAIYLAARLFNRRLATIG